MTRRANAVQRFKAKTAGGGVDDLSSLPFPLPFPLPGPFLPLPLPLSGPLPLPVPRSCGSCWGSL